MNTAQTSEEATREEPVIEANEVFKSYRSPIPFRRSVDVLRGASLEIHSGEIVGIIGENGSGKSTLMKILVGILDADSGTISTSGAVGWCPQDSRLYDRLTIDETFRLFGEAYGMSASEVAAKKEELAQKLDFQKFLDYQIRNLSGGNRQKVNLSVSLMHDPDVLLLDEPYTGFDWGTYLAFWELTEDLVSDGVGIGIISHLINEQERFDRIYELHDGTLSQEHKK